MSKTRPYIPDGVDHQSRVTPTRQQRQLTSELIEESPRTGHHRPMRPTERRLLTGHHASYTFPLVVVLCIVCACIWVYRG